MRKKVEANINYFHFVYIVTKLGLNSYYHCCYYNLKKRYYANQLKNKIQANLAVPVTKTKDINDIHIISDIHLIFYQHSHKSHVV